MPENNYLDLANYNLDAAKTLVSGMDDEIKYNFAAYHLQQAVELTLKYILTINGYEFPKVHSINQLIACLEKNNLFHMVSEYIDDHSDMLTNWESQTRYIVNYKVEKRKIDKALIEVESFLDEVREQTYDSQIEEEITL